jgi:hypothetical protein
MFSALISSSIALDKFVLLRVGLGSFDGKLSGQLGTSCPDEVGKETLLTASPDG